MINQSTIKTAESYLQNALAIFGCKVKDYPDKTTGEIRKSLYLDIPQDKALPLSETLESLKGSGSYVTLRLGKTILNLIAVKQSKFDENEYSAIFCKPIEAKRINEVEAEAMFENTKVNMPIYNEEILF